MRTKPAQKIKIGVFTLAGLILVCAAIFMIGSGKNMFKRTYTIYGEFNNVGGLLKGSIVRLNGVNAGSVSDVTVINDTTVRVEIRILHSMASFLKDDAVASIGTDGLMGDKVIIITPGGKSPVRLADGSHIRTHNPIDFEKTMARLNRVTENVEVISGSLASISSQISDGKGTVGKLIYDDGLERNLNQTVLAAQQAIVSVHTTMDHMGYVTKNAEAISGSLLNMSNQITSGKGTLGKLIYNDSLERGLRNTVSATEQTILAARVTMDSIRTTIGSADKTFKAAQQGAEGFKENMDALKHSFFLRGYFKKKAKAEQAHRVDSLNNVENEAQPQIIVKPAQPAETPGGLAKEK
jgi:phospholipid/cholesterol/gamma-HCH transport system substrate-binding protein